MLNLKVLFNVSETAGFYRYKVKNNWQDVQMNLFCLFHCWIRFSVIYQTSFCLPLLH